MKKLSIKFATAALAVSAIPLASGCGDSSATSDARAQAGHAPVERPAVTPLKPIAVPPTLRTISFHDDLFAPPPAPNLSSEKAEVALELAEAVERAASKPKVVVATEAPEAFEQLDSNWSGTQVASEPIASQTNRLPPLNYPSADATPPNGTRFDYVGVGSASSEVADATNAAPEIAVPEIAVPFVPPSNKLEPYSVAPSENAPTTPEPRDTAWSPSPINAPADESFELPLELNPPSAAPQAEYQPPMPSTAAAPSDLATPMLVDTSEWSSQQAHQQQLPAQPAPVPQPVATPYAQQFPELASPVLPIAEERPTVTVEPLQLPLANAGADMGVVRHHARMLIDRGTRMGERGALYSAKNDFKHALRMVAEAQDTATGDRRHSHALARGWQALAEAGDFSPGGAETVDLTQVVSAHRTGVLANADLERTTPLEAMQRYFAYAQEQLALAGGDESVAAEAMHRLGKTHAFIARESSKAARSHGPRALALQQAALMVDEQHDGAANELGVLLAKYGQWNDARRVLLHAVTLRPTAEKWQNLAVVHDNLGEGHLAALARQEAEVAAVEARMHAGAEAGRVQWVGADQFVRSGTTGRAIPATAPQYQPAPVVTESPTAWKLPWMK